MPHGKQPPASGVTSISWRACLYLLFLLTVLGVSTLTAVLQSPGAAPQAAKQRVCQRVEGTPQEPFGPLAASQHPLCRVVSQPGVSRIAVVGNGPVTSVQREEIETSDLVVRFNLMNNWKRLRERVDVWAIRWSSEAASQYWGITNLSDEEADSVLLQVKGLWLIGGEQWHADWLLDQYPKASQEATVLIPLDPLLAWYKESLNVTDGLPSTGFAGTLAAALCAAPSATVHLFGMNWHANTWVGHKMDVEKAFWREASRQGRVVIHETVCYGMRECGAADIDQSCHWDDEGRYMCLLGKPRQWLDKTDSVEAFRQRDFELGG